MLVIVVLVIAGLIRNSCFSRYTVKAKHIELSLELYTAGKAIEYS